MKTTVSVIILALFLCAGCATRYNITLSNGEVISAKGKPHYDKSRGIWIYKNAAGQLCKVPGGSVTEIAPRSMSGGDSPNFTSAAQK